MWNPDGPRIGVLPFTVDRLPYALVAAALSAERGIGVRHGCFCAHPLMAQLLDVDAAATALTVLTTDGPRWTCRCFPDGTDSRPYSDRRPWPQLPVDLG